MKACPYCGGHYSDNVAVCPIDQHSLAVPIEPVEKTRAIAGPDKVCPVCGVTNDCTYIVEPRSLFSWPAFILGGIFAVLMRNAGHVRKVRCNQCEARFYVRHRLSIFAWILFWLLVAPAIIALVCVLVIFLGYFFSR